MRSCKGALAFPTNRPHPVLTVVAFAWSCTNNVTTFNPTPTMHTTFFLTGNTIDPDGDPCTPPTPPAPTPPAAPAAARILVGYQDWRNTTSNTSGDVCTTSSGKRFEGVVSFDMTAVAANLNSAPFKTLSGTITYHINSNKVPQSFQGIDLCVASLQTATAVPTTNGLVTMNLTTGGSLPASPPPSLGPINLPGFAASGTSSSGPATVNTSPPDPTVTVEVTTLLSDWGATKPGTLAIAFVPQGPTLAQMGLTKQPFPDPVPVNRSTAACISNIKDIAMTVHVGR